VGPTRRQPLAPDVTGATDIAPELQSQLATLKERQVQAKAEARKAKDRARNAKRKGKRASFDLPEELIKALQYVGRLEDVVQSDLVALALADWLEDYKAGRVKLDPMKRPARSLHVTYGLDIPDFDLPTEWQINSDHGRP